jgi:hypothetical protein
LLNDQQPANLGTSNLDLIANLDLVINLDLIEYVKSPALVPDHQGYPK